MNIELFYNLTASYYDLFGSDSTLDNEETPTEQDVAPEQDSDDGKREAADGR